MKNKRSSRELPKEEILMACLRQTEWMLFQASMRGLVADKRSIEAVIESKRRLFGENTTGNLYDAMIEAIDALDKEGGSKEVKKQKTLTGCLLAYTCFRLAWDAFYWDSRAIPSVYMRSLGNLKSKSPLAGWLREKSVEP